MTVKRIVADVEVGEIATAQSFYGDVLGLDVLMDQGWIVTFGSAEQMRVQISFMTEGGSGAPTPDMTIEVDDLDGVLSRIETRGIAIEYGPVEEPWGVRRFFVRDPFGKLVNVMEHV